MTAHVLRGDARHLPLPDGSVDLIVTSPPYFGLRSYTDGGEHYAGQIGSESTPAEWLDALLECTAEWVRVLKPEGNLFVNLGDKYSTGNSGQSGLAELGKRWAGGGHSDGKAKRPSAAVPGYPPKSLLGLPWRYAIGCTDQLGLILRAEIIWAKPNGLPESVTDRVRRAHEQVFHFTKQPRYYAAVDEIREPHAALPKVRGIGGYDGANGQPRHGFTSDQNPLGKLPGSVWEIPSSPLQVPERLGVDHFAAFPPALVRPIVLGWSPPGVCTACGHGRRPASDVQYLSGTNRPGYETAVTGRHMTHIRMGDGIRVTITGYACACPQPDAPTRPAVVLDPFGGTGTTALVASCYGRVGVTVDLSADYCRLAHWRVNDPGERARARAMPKPPPVPDGMEPLFTM
jgi:DNA modification methylase